MVRKRPWKSFRKIRKLLIFWNVNHSTENSGNTGRKSMERKFPGRIFQNFWYASRGWPLFRKIRKLLNFWNVNHSPLKISDVWTGSLFYHPCLVLVYHFFVALLYLTNCYFKTQKEKTDLKYLDWAPVKDETTFLYNIFSITITPDVERCDKLILYAPFLNRCKKNISTFCKLYRRM